MKKFVLFFIIFLSVTNVFAQEKESYIRISAYASIFKNLCRYDNNDGFGFGGLGFSFNQFGVEASWQNCKDLFEDKSDGIFAFFVTYSIQTDQSFPVGMSFICKIGLSNKAAASELYYGDFTAATGFAANLHIFYLTLGAGYDTFKGLHINLGANINFKRSQTSKNIKDK